jgi:hypothetical protein
LDFGLESIQIKPQEFSPDPARARFALNYFAANPSIDVKPTEKNRVELAMGRQDFNDLFGVALHPGEFSKRTSERITLSDAFVVPEKSLTVPDALKDTIDFAYIPRPIEFYGSSYRPPSESVPHLHLDDVRAALNAPRAHRQEWTGRGVKVAMVDSGFFPHRLAPINLRTMRAGTGLASAPTSSPSLPTARSMV